MASCSPGCEVVNKAFVRLKPGDLLLMRVCAGKLAVWKQKRIQNIAIQEGKESDSWTMTVKLEGEDDEDVHWWRSLKKDQQFEGMEVLPIIEGVLQTQKLLQTLYGPLEFPLLIIGI